MIDFFGPGFDVAERLGILPQLEAIHYPVERLLFVDARSRPRGAIDHGRTRHVAFRDRHFNFMRTRKGVLRQTLSGLQRGVRREGRMKSLRVGGLELADVRIMIEESGAPDFSSLLLVSEFLRNFRLVVDRPAGEVTLVGSIPWPRSAASQSRARLRVAGARSSTARSRSCRSSTKALRRAPACVSMTNCSRSRAYG
jgi:hypothetical protein